MSDKLSPELEEVLREAQSRGSLVDAHPDLKDRSPESPRDPRFQQIRHSSTPEHKPDPRTFGPQSQPRISGYGNPVDSPEFLDRWHGADALITRRP